MPTDHGTAGEVAGQHRPAWPASAVACAVCPDSRTGRRPSADRARGHRARTVPPRPIPHGNNSPEDHPCSATRGSRRPTPRRPARRRHFRPCPGGCNPWIESDHQGLGMRPERSRSSFEEAASPSAETRSSCSPAPSPSIKKSPIGIRSPPLPADLDVRP